MMIATDLVPLVEVTFVEAMLCSVAEFVLWEASGAARVVSWLVATGLTDSVFGAVVVVVARDAGSAF